METPTIAEKRNTRVRETRHAASCLGFAASPTFALMAFISETDVPAAAMCASAPGGLPIDAMAWMYLLMSLFNASPWLKLVSSPARRLTQPARQPEGD
jgi:hypothetical protein